MFSVASNFVVIGAGLVTQLPEGFYNFMLELQGKLAKTIKSVGKIDHTLYPFMSHAS